MARLIDADNKQELTRKCLVEQIENIISDYEQRQLSETDIEDVNYGDLKCISDALQFYQLKTCSQPTAEPQKVRGEWLKKDVGEILAICNQCKYPVSWWHKSNYCPNCGADCRGENNAL